jgi:hypothetical protein
VRERKEGEKETSSFSGFRETDTLEDRGKIER